MNDTLKKSIIFLGKEKLAFKISKLPKIERNQILIQIKTCTLCGSDLKIYKNGSKRLKKGRVIGHEISGKVIGSNIPSRFKIGDKVSLGADVPCMNCFNCKNNKKCTSDLAIGHELDGGFSSHLIVNSHVLKYGPINKFKNLSYDIAAMSEPLACCINGYKNFIDRDIKNILIFGAGPIGNMLALMGKYYGAKKVVLCDNRKIRLELSKKIKSSDYYFHNNINKYNDKIMSISNNKGFDLIFIACPDRAVQNLSFKYVSHNGSINFFSGLPKNSDPVNIDTNLIHYKEIILTGSHGSTPSQHKSALNLLENNEINLDAFLTKSYNIEDFQQAYDHALTGRALKIAIKPN